MPHDYGKLANQELRNLIANASRLQREDVMAAALRELQRRGVATRGDYRRLKWNHASVADALRPFQTVAAQAHGNRRTPFTEAGGRRIGRSKDDPDKLWVDSYSRVQTRDIDYVMRAEIKHPGDDPIFELWNWSGRNLIGRFTYDRLAEALEIWQKIASEATGANGPQDRMGPARR